MDSTITGLNKVICHAIDNSDNGKQVSISNGANTWTATIVNLRAVMLIPSIPTPARRTYTVTFGDFTKDIPMGYGEVYDVFLAEGYDYVISKDFDKLKADTEQTIIDHLYDKGDKDGTQFKFGVDEQGRYGYVKEVDGADTVVPFRTGQETLCYYLGEGRSFNVAAACSVIKNTYGIDVDYHDLTVNNFVTQPITGYKTQEGIGGESVRDTQQWLHVTGTYVAPTIGYDRTAGTLTIAGSTWFGTCYLSGDAGAGGAHDSQGGTSTMKAYLIVPMNA